VAYEKRDEDKVLLWLYNNLDKKRDVQPDWTGPGRIHKDVLKDLVDAYKKHGDADGLKLRVAGWNKTGKSGEYIFVVIEAEKPKQEEKGDDEIPF